MIFLQSSISQGAASTSLLTACLSPTMAPVPSSSISACLLRYQPALFSTACIMPFTSQIASRYTLAVPSTHSQLLNQLQPLHIQTHLSYACAANSISSSKGGTRPSRWTSNQTCTMARRRTSRLAYIVCDIGLRNRAYSDHSSSTPPRRNLTRPSWKCRRRWCPSPRYAWLRVELFSMARDICSRTGRHTRIAHCSCECSRF